MTTAATVPVAAPRQFTDAQIDTMRRLCVRLHALVSTLPFTGDNVFAVLDTHITRLASPWDDTATKAARWFRRMLRDLCRMPGLTPKNRLAVWEIEYLIAEIGLTNPAVPRNDEWVTAAIPASNVEVVVQQIATLMRDLRHTTGFFMVTQLHDDFNRLEWVHIHAEFLLRADPVVCRRGQEMIKLAVEEIYSYGDLLDRELTTVGQITGLLLAVKAIRDFGV